MAIKMDIENKSLVVTKKDSCHVATPVFCGNLKHENPEKNSKNLDFFGKNNNLENSLKLANLPTTTTTTTTIKDINYNNNNNHVSGGFRLPLATCGNMATYKTENSLYEHIKEITKGRSVLKNHILNDLSRVIILKILQNNVVFLREITKITNTYCLKLERTFKKLQKNNIIRPIQPYEHLEALQKHKKNLLKSPYIREYHIKKLKFYTLTDFALQIYKPMEADIKNNCKYAYAMNHPEEVKQIRKKEEKQLLNTCHMCKKQFPFPSLTFIPAIQKYLCQKCTLKKYGVTDEEIKRYSI